MEDFDFDLDSVLDSNVFDDSSPWEDLDDADIKAMAKDAPEEDEEEE